MPISTCDAERRSHESRSNAAARRRSLEDDEGDQLVNATKANAVIMASNLRGNAIFKGLIEKKRLKIVASYCDLSTGKVTLL